jgi:hypothetical protein
VPDPVVSDRVVALGGLLPLTLPLLPVGEPIPEPGGPEPNVVAFPLVPVLPEVASFAPDLPAGFELVAAVPGWSDGLFVRNVPTWPGCNAHMISMATRMTPNTPPHTTMLRITRSCCLASGSSAMMGLLGIGLCR